MASIAHAGIFSSLGKISKAAKKVDADAALKVDVDLPKHFPDHAPVKLIETPDGNWQVKLLDGTQTTLRALSDKPTSQYALVIERFDLPKDLSKLDSIPDNYPIFIRYKNNTLFSFKAGEVKTISLNNVEVTVKDINTLERAMWNMQRPIISKGTRWLQLDKSSSKTLSDATLSSTKKIETVGSGKLLDALRQSRLQTVVLAGEVKAGKLLAPNADKAVDIATLRRTAESYDVSLIIMDTTKPTRTLKAAIKNIDKSQRRSVADVFASIAQPTEANPLKLSINKSEQSQVGILTKLETRTEIDSIHTHGLSDVPTLFIYKPSQEREEELDNRMIAGVHSNITFYFILSAVIGFVFTGVSWKYWNKIWPINSKDGYANYAVYTLIRLLHVTAFVLLYLPLLGLLGVVLFIVLFIAKVINIILIKPIRWVFSFFSRLLTR